MNKYRLKGFHPCRTDGGWHLENELGVCVASFMKDDEHWLPNDTYGNFDIWHNDTDGEVFHHEDFTASTESEFQEKVLDYIKRNF